MKNRFKHFYSLLILSMVFITGCGNFSQPDEEGEAEEVGINNPQFNEFKQQALVSFSYDDGLRSNYELALPLHEKHGIPATFHIIGKRAVKENEHENFMTTEMIEDSFERGVDIASHSYYHNNLTEITEDELHFEMSESKRVLENIVGEGNVTSIAIPYSTYNETVKKVASDYYEGMRVWGKDTNSYGKIDQHELNSSIAVVNTTTFEEIKKEIDKAVEEQSWTIIMLHGIDPEKEDRFAITPDLLEETLKYINTFSSDELLSINIKDALEFINN